MTSEPSALTLAGVAGGYGHTTVLRDIDLEVATGSVTALLGANGAGKSTCLRIASGLLRPFAGSVSLFGEDVTKWPTVTRAKRGLCHIPEGRAIFRSLTVRENIELQAWPGQQREALERAMTAFPILGERRSQQAGTLSGGQQQMLAMARAYVQEPRLVLVDEASLGLAPIVVDEIFEFLESITKAGASLLLVDQFVSRALAMADQVYVLGRGSVVFHGTAEQLRTESDIFAHYLGETAQSSAV